jgi:hypothetical protein
MAYEVFENLLSGCKLSWEKAKEEQRLAEQKEEQNKIKKEILHKRAMEILPYIQYYHPNFELVEDTTEEEYQEELKYVKLEKKKDDDEREATRKQNEELQKKSDADRKAKEEAEAKLREEKEAQAKKEADEKAKVEAENKAKEDEEKKKLLAPDKEKLLEFATIISLVTAPAVKSKDADVILEKAMSKITEAITILQEESKKL